MAWFGYKLFRNDSGDVQGFSVEPTAPYPNPALADLRQARLRVVEIEDSLAYQTDLAQSFCKRVHDLEQQLTRTQIQLTEETVSHKATHENYVARVAELIAENDQLLANYERLFGKLSDALWAEVEEDDTGDDETETEGDAEFDGEETAIIDSAKYGDQ